MTMEHRVNNGASLRRAAGAINKDPFMIGSPFEFSQFLPEGASAEEARRLHYFSMAKVLCDRTIPQLVLLRSVYPPYGLSEFYREDGMTDIGERSAAIFIPDGRMDKTKWEVLRHRYRTKMTNAFLTQFGNDDQKTDPVITAMSLHRMPNYHINTRPSHEEAYERFSGQTDNAVNVMIGLLRILPRVIKGGQDLTAVIRNSRALSIDISSLSMIQFQYFLLEVLEGKNRVPTGEGWNFNPSLFKIDTSPDLPAGRLTTKVPLLETEVTYPQEIINPPEELVPNFRTPEGAKRIKLGEIEPGTTHYGCPAYGLIGAMWDDLAHIIDKSDFYKLS